MVRHRWHPAAPVQHHLYRQGEGGGALGSSLELGAKGVQPDPQLTSVPPGLNKCAEHETLLSDMLVRQIQDGVSRDAGHVWLVGHWRVWTVTSRRRLAVVVVVVLVRAERHVCLRVGVILEPFIPDGGAGR